MISDAHLLWTGFSLLEGHKPSPSLLAAFNHNSTDITFEYTDSSGTVHQGNNETAFTCSVDARWAPVKMWMLPGNDFDYHVHEITPFDLGRSSSFGFLFNPNQITDLEHIHISPQWATSLNVPISNDTDSLTMERLIEVAGSMSQDGFTNGTTDNFLSLVAVGMGMMITDGLARLSWTDQFVALVSNDTGHYLQDFGTNATQSYLVAPNINPNWLQLRFSSTRQGWSYGISGRTIKLALAVLILHLVIALGHTVIVVGSRNVWTTKRWKSIGELLVLAINSDATEELQGTCAGIDMSRTWHKKLKIREIEHGHLGLVVEDYREARDLQQGLTVGEEKPKPIPGRRYGYLQTSS